MHLVGVAGRHRDLDSALSQTRCLMYGPGGSNGAKAVVWIPQGPTHLDHSFSLLALGHGHIVGSDGIANDARL